MNNMRNKILSLLVLLLTAASGAWAQTETPLVTIQASENSTFTSGSKTFNDIATVTITGNGYIDVSGWASCMLTVTPADGVTITSVKFYGSVNGDVVEDTSSPFEAENKYDSNVSREVTKVNGTKAFDYGVTKIEVYGTAEPPIEVAWDASTKTGTFSMPGSDVVLTPQYAPTAKWDVVETVPQQPAALEGIIAGQDAAIVTAGQSAQGTVMYAVTTTAETAPALEAFSATVPTAKTYDDATTLYVWYYIQGHDTPDGQQATEENTFNDSEISATPLKVDILTNKFDIQFNAANANTIEAGKATVTVGGTAATVTEGKLQGVKMGSEVKVKANTGYKFRKVEVKKTEAPAGPLTYATKEGAVTRIKFKRNSSNLYADFTYSNGSFTRTGGSTSFTFPGSWTMKEENGVLTMSGIYDSIVNFVCTFYAYTNEYTQSSTGDWNCSFNGIEVNGNDITSQLTEVK